MPSSPEMVVLLFVLATFVPVLLIVILWQHRRIRRKLISVETGEGSDWRLGLICEQGRRYSLCITYEVTYSGSEDDYGILVEYSCLAGGEELVSEAAGAGDRLLKDGTRHIRTLYRCSHTAVLGNCRSSATAMLCTAGPFDHSTEVTVSGRVTAAPGTSLVRSEVYFARYR